MPYKEPFLILTLSFIIFPILKLRPYLFVAGGPFTPFQRLLPADYADGESLPRAGLQFSSLPSARVVSVAVHQAQEEASSHEPVSLMVMQFAQFLDHDLTLTPGKLTNQNTVSDN